MRCWNQWAGVALIVCGLAAFGFMAIPKAPPQYGDPVVPVESFDEAWPGVVWHESAESGIAYLRFGDWLSEGENDPWSHERGKPGGFTTPAPSMGDKVFVLAKKGDLLSVRFETGSRAGLVQDWPAKWVKPIK